MTVQEEEASQAVAKLNKLTQEGQVQWHIIDPTDLEERIEGRIQGPVFETTYGKKRLFLYRKIQEKTVDPTLAAAGVGKSVGETYTEVTHKLEIVDSHERPVWSFPRSSAVRDLYSTVSYHASGAGDLISQLKEEDDESSVKVEQ